MTWDEKATLYGQFRLPTQLYYQPLGELRKQIFWEKLLEHAKGLTLEAGCGTGKNSLILTKRKVAPVLIDFSKTAVRTSKRMFESLSKEAFFVIGDMRFMPFRNETFDYVHSDSTLEHIRNCRKATKELERITKKGGYVFAAVPNKSRPDGVEMWKRIARPNYTQISYTPNELRDLFQETQMYIDDLFGYDILSPMWSAILRKIQKCFCLGNLKDPHPNTISIAREEGGSGFLEQAVLQLLNQNVFSRRILHKFVTARHNSLVSINLAIILRKSSF